MGGKDEAQFWLKPEPSLRLSCVTNAFPLHLYCSAESRCSCAGNSLRKRRPAALMQRRENNHLVKRMHKHMRGSAFARHLVIDHRPGAKACVSTSWFLSLVSCEDHCLLLMWLTHPNEVMIHAKAFKQVEVRLESGDGFPGGLPRERGWRWGGSVCERGWGRVEGHWPRVRI